jgi:hypothetical protein
MRRIQIVLEAFTNLQLTALEQLALVICIRKLLGQPDVDFDKVANETAIVRTVQQMIEMLLVDQINPDLAFVAYYIKLEMMWILANLMYASDDVCFSILTEGPPNEEGQRKLSSVVKFISMALEGDIPMKDLVIHVLYNLTVIDFNISKMLLEQTELVDKFNASLSLEKLPKEVVGGITEILNNLA